MSYVVQWVEAVGHDRLPQGGNHWCFYLDIGDNRSVCLDITPSYTVPSTSIPGGSKANMIVSLLSHNISGTAQKVMRLDVSPGKTVGEIVNLIIQHGRHKYEFNDQGQGCRFWTIHQMDLFYEHGILVDRAQIQAAKATLLTQWPDQIQYPLVQGPYYV